MLADKLTGAVESSAVLCPFRTNAVVLDLALCLGELNRALYKRRHETRGDTDADDSIGHGNVAIDARRLAIREKKHGRVRGASCNRRGGALEESTEALFADRLPIAVHDSGEPLLSVRGLRL
eukprot:Amastigsp_a680408_74.p5 type:complete len:122 gc:universal Amastigsp_a680408_74:536-171(-)